MNHEEGFVEVRDLTGWGRTLVLVLPHKTKMKDFGRHMARPGLRRILIHLYDPKTTTLAAAVHEASYMRGSVVLDL